MNPETTPQRAMILSFPPDRLVLIVTVSPATSTPVMLSYQDVLKPGTPKMSPRYSLIASEEGSVVFDVACASRISGAHSITGIELALAVLLSPGIRVTKGAKVNIKRMEQTDRSEMNSMPTLYMM
jgi:hypothetical protein